MRCLSLYALYDTMFLLLKPSGLSPYFLVPYYSIHVLTYIMADQMSLLYVDFFTHGRNSSVV
jgi:hypothetical protein